MSLILTIHVVHNKTNGESIFVVCHKIYGGGIINIIEKNCGLIIITEAILTFTSCYKVKDNRIYRVQFINEISCYQTWDPSPWTFCLGRASHKITRVIGELGI